MKKVIFFLFLSFFLFLNTLQTNGFKAPSKDFKLVQKENVSYLKYKDKTIKTYFHTSKKNPFIWREGCDLLTKKFNEAFKKLEKDKKSGIVSEDEKLDSQKVWESLTIKEQRKCVKENLFRTLWVEKTDNSRFFALNKSGREWVVSNLFDSSSYKIYENFTYSGYKIKVGKLGIYFIYNEYGDDYGKLGFIDYNTKKFNVISDSEITQTTDIIDYELLLNKKIKIFYKKLEEKEIYSKIISVK